jgi:hypothetical protein
MVNEMETIVDPLGNRVKLQGDICPEVSFKAGAEVYDDASTVISRPALLIELTQNLSIELYYYRSIGWNDTLLIAARKTGTEWEAYECKRNPSSTILSELLRRGKQLI